MSQVQLLWSKSGVFIHPTKNSKENVAGYLSLVRPSASCSDSDILVSWVPESLIRLSKEDFDSYVAVDLQDDGTVSSKPIYVSRPPTSARSTHAFSLRLGDIYSLQSRQPSLGWWFGSVLIFTKSQVTLPALFFHDTESAGSTADRKRRAASFQPFDDTSGAGVWGGQIFIDCLKKYAKIIPSTLERGVLLVNPDTVDKLAFSPSGVSSVARKQSAWEEVKWGVFEKLAQVTRISRNAGQKVFDRTPAPVRAMLNIPEVEQLSQDFDSARVFLAEWALGIAEDGRRKRYDVVWTDEGGLDDLQGASPASSMSSDFALVNASTGVTRRNPVTLEEWNSFFDEHGHLKITVSEAKERIFHGGLEPPARPEAWLFLLGVFPWDSDKNERASIVSEKRNEYYRLKRRWWDDTDRQANDDFWKDQKSRIEKDVLRTDRHLDIFAQSSIPHPDPDSRFASSGANPHLEQLKDMLITYNEFNENLGYIQGMTDLLSPLYVVLQDDCLAFTAFCQYMLRMERNFLRDQSGMRDQLECLNHLTQLMLPRLYDHLSKADSTHFFFFFRMLLVWYKREFSWEDVLRLWEVLWTDYLSSQFHLFISLAILDLNKDIIMGRLHHFDEILKYINDLGMSLDLDAVLIRAEQLFKRFKMTVNLLDRKASSTAQPSKSTSSPTEQSYPTVSDDLRLLLSTDIIEVHEQARPEGAGGG